MEVFAVLAVLVLYVSSTHALSNRPFPADFKFGVSTSAYQIEGAWNESGKGVSIWDYITHNRSSFILDRSNGDVACDSYHKLDDDIAMLKHLGVDFYRFSISWTRILPTGRVNEGVNLDGVNYYRSLLMKLKKENIDAMVTIFHFDLPVGLQSENMFVNGSLNSLFVDYARLAFLLFGNEVKYWVTFNEPRGVCNDFLEQFSKQPGRDSYTCAHNIIKCHAAVYRMYDEEFRDEYGGSVGIVLNTNWDEPATDKKADVDAAERKLIFEFSWFAHPIIYGDYPELMKQRIKQFTLPFFSNRLPKFTEDEKLYIKGTADFLGINHYTSSYVSDQPNFDLFRTFEKDLGVLMTYDPEWKNTSLDWLKVTPFGMRKILNWTYTTYKIPLIVTENGYVEDGILLDDERISYLESYWSGLLDAIYIDKVDVFGYSTWSLMDNWEWTSGYTQKFGLYYVNFSSPTRERIPKKSVAYYKKVVESHCLVDHCE
ncbi:myrosinase 1-like [Coccinella septempunctata]|uniref:myrosinase 1-like n=1 Tax=Coccinella septempunctata TaxID=41139 RepID=UPI001D066011|nr:myrosinase 1-like [Coccinella septempunctata]